jgi:hypothetical protein
VLEKCCLFNLVVVDIYCNFVEDWFRRNVMFDHIAPVPKKPRYGVKCRGRGML